MTGVNLLAEAVKYDVKPTRANYLLICVVLSYEISALLGYMVYAASSAELWYY